MCLPRRERRNPEKFFRELKRYLEQTQRYGRLAGGAGRMMVLCFSEGPNKYIAHYHLFKNVRCR